MDSTGESSADTVVPSWATRHRFDVTDYHRMGASGILDAQGRIELVAGEIIEMAPVGGPHIGAVIALNHLLVAAVAGRVRVSVQNPIRLGDRSEPQPDLALLRPRADNYRGAQPPLAEDVLLVIEVADSSLQYDRQVKLPLYARHGIPEVWIVDLDGGTIEVCRTPADGGYTRVTRTGRDAVIEPFAVTGAMIAVADILAA